MKNWMKDCFFIFIESARAFGWLLLFLMAVAVVS
jgi:hypothetical protein